MDDLKTTGRPAALDLNLSVLSAEVGLRRSLNFYVAHPLRTGEEPLLFLVVNDYRLQIFGFDNQTAVQAFHIIHAVTPGDNDGAAMLTIEWYELHKDELGLILSMSSRLSSAKIQCFYPRSAFGCSLG